MAQHVFVLDSEKFRYPSKFGVSVLGAALSVTSFVRMFLCV